MNCYSSTKWCWKIFYLRFICWQPSFFMREYSEYIGFLWTAFKGKVFFDTFPLHWMVWEFIKGFHFQNESCANLTYFVINSNFISNNDMPLRNNIKGVDKKKTPIKTKQKDLVFFKPLYDHFYFLYNLWVWCCSI